MKLRIAKKIIKDFDRYDRYSKGQLAEAYLVWKKHGGVLDVALQALLSYRLNGFIPV